MNMISDLSRDRLKFKVLLIKALLSFTNHNYEYDIRFI